MSRPKFPPGLYERVIADRMTVIEPLLEPGKQVLDVGCVDARSKEESAGRVQRKANALHRRIVELAPETLGADIDAEGVVALNEAGFRCVEANVETMELGRTFDLIVAGEIIEHLENCGLFLHTARRHLNPGGRLIISTPNPFYAKQGWKIWRHGRPQVHEDHTNWQDPLTLGQLFERCGFEQEAGYWVQPKQTWKAWKSRLQPYFSHSFLAVAKPKPDAATASR
ncbi:MAG: class I SAM-dependent methyltransferase [Planctomycetota bacterium]